MWKDGDFHNKFYACLYRALTGWSQPPARQLPTLHTVLLGWPEEDGLWSCCVQGVGSPFPPRPHQPPFIPAASEHQDLWNLLRRSTGLPRESPQHSYCQGCLTEIFCSAPAVRHRQVTFSSFPSQPKNYKLHVFICLDSSFVVLLIVMCFSEEGSSGLDTIIQIPLILTYLCP